MKLDIRAPIGALFIAIGLLLAGDGLLGQPRTLAAALPPLNVDLVCGAAMIAFGLAMLFLALTARR